MQPPLNPNMDRKRQALSRFLQVDPGSLRESGGTLYTFKAFFHGSNEAYLILTDEEATIAAEHAVDEKLWLICLEALFAYFDINSYPADILGKMKTKDIRHANHELKTLIYHTCGMDILRRKMLTLGNRRNILADYDQTEYSFEGYYIYRLY